MKTKLIGQVKQAFSKRRRPNKDTNPPPWISEADKARLLRALQVLLVSALVTLANSCSHTADHSQNAPAAHTVAK